MRRLYAAGVERDDFSSKRHRALSFYLSMISAQTLRVCREGKPVSTFPDHALSVSTGVGGFAGFLHLHEITPGIGLRAVDIGKAVDFCELAGRERLAVPARNFTIACQRHHGAAGI